jgi:hypothetical protein
MAVSKETEIYLQDHLAGAAAGVELARRTAGSNSSNDYGPELSRLADEIAEDRETLIEIAEALGASRSRLKEAGAWAGEKVGRLKPNNSILSYSPLSRLIELEGLVLGVTGKRSLWRSLQQALGEELAGHRFEELLGRAEDQRERLERLRLQAARDALGSAARNSAATS